MHVIQQRAGGKFNGQLAPHRVDAARSAENRIYAAKALTNQLLVFPVQPYVDFCQGLTFYDDEFSASNADLRIGEAVDQVLQA